MKRLKEGMKTLAWVAGAVKGARPGLVLLFFVKILQGLEGIAFAFCLRYAVDAAVSGSREQFVRSALWLSGLVLLSILLYWGSIYYSEKPVAMLGKSLRLRVFDQLMRRAYGPVSRVHSGEWMTRIDSDTGVVSRAVATILPSLAGMIVQVVAAFLSLFLILPRAAWILIPCAAGLVALSLFLRVRLKNYHHEVQKREGLVRSFMQEHLGSMAVVRAYTREKQSVEQAGERLEALVGIRMRRTRFTAACASGIYALVRIGYLAGVVLCGWQLLGGVITYGMMTAILQLIRQAEAPLADVTRAVPQFFNMIASAERLIEIERIDPDQAEKSVEPSEVKRYYGEEFASVGLRDATFSYIPEPGEGEEVLKHLDIEIRKGEYVAFTGESGCGKSTAMNLLMSFYPLNEGERYLKDKNGGERPLTSAWRGLFAYVPQENHLLSGRLRDVIAFSAGGEKIDDGEIWRALRIASAEGFVRELPEGLDTVLGEHGSGLSEGQMQRIAIARAIFSDRPVLLLDEATSALDEETERTLLSNLREMTDRTVIIITHRPAALAICDKEISFRREFL